ncbi:hypothetical protein B4135_3464 [Caldibacillus debilis]|uniref:Uncharacterized protein n=1 Tax=Caldibacillus debilis TaxID=301148 RepID=A0A150LE54_9BACI|nr:hypothetical protein B4135_3464 [Caldibacillus debilis]
MLLSLEFAGKNVAGGKGGRGAQAEKGKGLPSFTAVPSLRR